MVNTDRRRQALVIKTLGGLAVEEDGGAVEGFASSKALLLLVYLACNPRTHRRELLADLLWDDRDQRRALANLRVVLSSLRKAVGPYLTITRDTVTAKPEAVRLDAAQLERVLGAGDVTAERVEEVAAAFALYRGDFLAGVHVREARQLEEWVVRERERLHRLASSGGQRLVACYLESGDYQAGIGHASRLLEIDPLLETGHRQLMSLLARRGQRAAALAQYESCRRLLADELAVEPAAETVTLYEAIRDDALPGPSLALETALPPVLSLPPFLSASAAAERRELFVTREAELAWLADHLTEAAAGSGCLLFVYGGAGTGKTWLLREFARRATAEHPSLLTAPGRCTAFSGSGDPYLPFRQLLGQLLGDVQTALVAGQLTREQATRLWQGLPDALAALLQHAPGLVDRLLPGPPLLARAQRALGDGHGLEPLRAPVTGDGIAATTPEDLQQQVTALLQALAVRRPLLLLLDDLQWADSATLALLFHLAHHLAGYPILIAAAYRSGELRARPDGERHPVLNLVDEARRRSGDVALDLGAVAAQQGPAFVDQLLDSEPNRLGEAFRKALLQRTEGHPLFTVELLRAMQGRGDLTQDADGCWREGQTLAWDRLPAQVEGVIATRIERVPAELRRLLEIASVEGESFTGQVLAQLQAGEERAVVRQLGAELDRRYRLVQVEGEASSAGRLARYRFRHALYRHYLYEQLDPVERVYLHRDVGLALEALHGQELTAVAPQLARHFREAGVVDKAVAYALQAGDTARNLYAHAEAIEHYRQALALLQAAGRYDQAARALMKLGLTHHQAFQFREARQAFEEGFALWQQPATAPNAALPPASRPLQIAHGEPGTLDPPLLLHRKSKVVIVQLFAGLVEISDTLEVMPDVAARWEIVDGGHTYIFHLRPDARWSDGVPLTAHDFEFAWKRLLAPETGAPMAGLLFDIRGARAFHRGDAAASQVGVQALDDHTLFVELAEPAAYFLTIAGQAATRAVPRHAVLAHGAAWSSLEKIVCSGPFTLGSWQPGEGMELVRNKLYHRPFKGNVERVQITFLSMWERAAELYESQKLDVLDLSPIRGSALQRFYARNLDDVFTTPSLATLAYSFDARHAPFADGRVRRAFVLATDRAAYARAIWEPNTMPATGGFVPPGVPGHTPDIGLPFDPARAQRLLARAGFPGGEGFPAIAMRVGSWAAEQARSLSQQWQRHLGVVIDVQLCSNRDIAAGEGALDFLGWGADYPDPDNFLRVACLIHRPSWEHEPFMQLVQQARGVADQGRRLALYGQADRLLIEEAYLLPLSYRHSLFLVKPWVKQCPLSPIVHYSWKDVIVEPH